MRSDVCDILDEPVGGGQLLRGQLPGDYKPVGLPDPTADVLARVYALILSWPAVDKGHEQQGEE